MLAKKTRIKVSFKYEARQNDLSARTDNVKVLL